MGSFGAISDAVKLGEIIYQTLKKINTADSDSKEIWSIIRAQLLTLRQFLAGCQRYTSNTLKREEAEVVTDVCLTVTPKLRLIQALVTEYLAKCGTKLSTLDKIIWALTKKSELEALSAQLETLSSLFRDLLTTLKMDLEGSIFEAPSESDEDKDAWRNGAIVDILKAVEADKLDPSATADSRRATLESKLKDASPMLQRKKLTRKKGDAFSKLKLPGKSKKVVHVLEEIGSFEENVALLSVLLKHADPYTMGLLRSPGYAKGPQSSRNKTASYSLLLELPPQDEWDRSRKPRDLQILLAQTLTKPDSCIPSLDERLGIARTISSAVYYLHCVGFVHKDITPESIQFLSPCDQSPTNGSKGRSPRSDQDRSEQKDSDGAQNITSAFETNKNILGFPFLSNFKLARVADRKRTQCHDKPNRPSSPTASEVWSRICMHPDRTSHYDPARKIYRMCYDKYSLGVVLLAVGCWKDLTGDAKLKQLLPDRRQLEEDRISAKVRGRLKEMAKELLPPSVGNLYLDVVLDCLSADLEDPYTADSLMADVLSKLWRIRLG
ncbi:hypothetical protein BJ508DRAFT_155662 [Ascobolus immersus RN42]|uniref:Protein kinase domain-containing protein n=1 Tax=Ascobolus immersus RN42 TaxID=1160509 RepID=A0A3N4HXM4_ASCIM|nr:hypothetical protein BJ508DRAFT_155662 [Ascobolus immersus RN42]